MIFLHTKWKEVKIFSYGGQAYCLIARRNKITNRIIFNTSQIGNWIHSCHNITKEDLIEINEWNNNEVKQDD